MSLTVYQRDGEDSIPVAEWEDGEWLSGADRMEAIFGDEVPGPMELMESLDGPNLFVDVPDTEDLTDAE